MFRRTSPGPERTILKREKQKIKLKNIKQIQAEQRVGALGGKSTGFTARTMCDQQVQRGENYRRAPGEKRTQNDDDR